jgi:hypothetical protein
MRRTKGLWRLAGPLAFSLFLVGTAGAGQISGQAGWTLYDYQSQFPDTVGANPSAAPSHLISTQILSLDLRKFGASGLSFHTFLRNQSRLAPADSTGNFFRLYGAYLDYRRTGAPFYLRAGRQFAVVGIASGTLDGLKARYDIGKRGSLTAFAGLESPYDSLRASSWKDGGMVGGEVSLSLPHESYLSLSGWQLNRYGALAKRRVGGDWVTGMVPGTDLSGHLEGDLIKNRLYRAVLRAEYHSWPRLSLNGRYEYRKPVFGEGSIFNTFQVSSNQEAGAGLSLKTWRSLSLSGEAVREFFDSNHADRLSFAAQSGRGSISYIRRTGWYGRSWDLALNGDRPLSGRVDVGATLNYTKYEDRADNAVLDYTLSGIARLGFRVSKGFLITTDVENLVNPNYTQNARFLVRALYDF